MVINLKYVKDHSQPFYFGFLYLILIVIYLGLVIVTPLFGFKEKHRVLRIVNFIFRKGGKNFDRQEITSEKAKNAPVNSFMS